MRPVKSLEFRNLNIKWIRVHLLGQVHYNLWVELDIEHLLEPSHMLLVLGVKGVNELLSDSL